MWCREEGCLLRLLYLAKIAGDEKQASSMVPPVFKQPELLLNMVQQEYFLLTLFMLQPTKTFATQAHKDFLTSGYSITSPLIF